MKLKTSFALQNFRKFVSLLLPVFASFLLLTSCSTMYQEETGTYDVSNGLGLDIAGVDGPYVKLSGDNLIISVIFENIVLEGGLRYEIPEYEDSYLEFSPSLEKEGTFLAISLSMKNFDKFGLLEMNAEKLPNGMPIPGISSGELPTVRFTLDLAGTLFHNMSFYLGPKFFGVFVPVPLNGVPPIITTRYHIEGFRAGTLSMLGPDENGENSGFLLLVNLSDQVKSLVRARIEKFED